MSVKEIKNKYFATKDYSLFKKSRGNREVDPVHVERIKRLIADKDTKAAITVNKNYEVIDGQHTLKARKEKLSRLKKSGSHKDAASIFLDMINSK